MREMTEKSDADRQECGQLQLMNLPEDTSRVARRGHAGQPGNGPTGETCKSCAHISRQKYSRTYIKCGLTRWTRGSATDIRAGDRGEVH